MKFGYIGNLFLSDNSSIIDKKVYFIVNECKRLEITLLVVTGGISYNYHTTLDFVQKLNKELSSNKIGFRFIIGNTDLYYPKDEFTADKESKINEIYNFYRSLLYYFPTHPFVSRDIRVLGFETWYDYTLYRGKSIDLKDITKKQKGLLKNKDVVYITNKSDYISGVSDTYDVRFTNYTLARMNSMFESYESRWGNVKNNIAVIYSIPSKVLLRNGLFSNYFGTFEGSQKYMTVLKNHKITECVIGRECIKEHTGVVNGIKFINPNNTITIKEYANE